jgi:WD40 repeat protein
MEKENISLEQKGTVTHASFASLSRNRLVTITKNKVNRLSSINLWDQELFGQPLMSIEDNDPYVDYSQFSPSTDNLLTISGNGNIKVYDINTKNIAQLGWQKASRCLSKDEISSNNILDIYKNGNFLDYFNILKSSLTYKRYYSYCEEK